MRARVTIFYKDAVFDPQGNTVAHSLKRAGFSGIRDVRMGKVVDVFFEPSGGDRQSLNDQVRRMCDEMLVNPVIESYSFELME